MYRSQLRIKAETIALLLLCVANILDLFVPRRDDTNYFVRIPIQLINGFLLVFMWLHLLVRSVHWTPVTRSIAIFIFMVCAYAVVYLNGNAFDFADAAPYLKLLLWTTSLVFFYEMMLRHGLNRNLMSLFIITFIVGAAKKMFESSLFESETLGGGDTIALPLLFIIPVVLFCMGGKTRIIVLGAVAVLIMVSLRRTAILGLVISFPFIYRYVGARLKTYQLVLSGLVLAAVMFYSWGYIGDALYLRFENLVTGDAGGIKDSFGSGRSEFYATVWNSWMHSGPVPLLFGQGLNSPHELLMRVHNVQHAHNDFLEIGHTFGLIGFAVWLVFLKKLWNLKREVKKFSPAQLPLFYICFLSYLVIALASGSILRTTTLSFGLTVSLLLYTVQQGKMVASLLEANTNPAAANLETLSN